MQELLDSLNAEADELDNRSKGVSVSNILLWFYLIVVHYNRLVKSKKSPMNKLRPLKLRSAESRRVTVLRKHRLTILRPSLKK